MICQQQAWGERSADGVDFKRDCQQVNNPRGVSRSVLSVKRLDGFSRFSALKRAVTARDAVQGGGTPGSRQQLPLTLPPALPATQAFPTEHPAAGVTPPAPAGPPCPAPARPRVSRGHWGARVSRAAPPRPALPSRGGTGPRSPRQPELHPGQGWVGGCRRPIEPPFAEAWGAPGSSPTVKRALGCQDVRKSERRAVSHPHSPGDIRTRLGPHGRASSKGQPCPSALQGLPQASGQQQLSLPQRQSQEEALRGFIPRGLPVTQASCSPWHPGINHHATAFWGEGGSRRDAKAKERGAVGKVCHPLLRGALAVLPTCPRGGMAPAPEARRGGKQLPCAVPLGCAAPGVHPPTAKGLRPARTHQEGSQMERELVTWSSLPCVTPVCL